MQSNFNDERLRFLIGDIRHKGRLHRTMEDIDIVIHAAALKHVPIAEYNPFESIKTNVIDSQNIVVLTWFLRVIRYVISLILLYKSKMVFSVIV